MHIDSIINDFQATKFGHITQAKQKLKALFLEQLPNWLRDADMLAADGYVTPVPYEIHTSAKRSIGGLPSLELIVTDSAPTSDQYMAQIYRHRVVAGVSLGGDDEETLQAQLERYLWCLRQICRNSHLVPNEGTGPLDTGGEQYFPLQQRPETVEVPFVIGGFIEIFVTTVE